MAGMPALSIRSVAAGGALGGPGVETIEGDMLNQHQNTIVPLSDFLRIGECVLDLPRREIDAPQRAAPLRITVKTQQVLMVLVAHQGRVVSREALIEWVWPDTLPTDDVLTQAIAQLRKAFCDDRDAPRYLETIAKGGYRLLAETAWLDRAEIDAARMPLPASAPRTFPVAVACAPDAPMEASAPPPTPPAIAAAAPVRRSLPWLDIAVALLVAGGAAALWLRPPGPGPAAARPAVVAEPVPATVRPVAVPPLEYQRITSLPGDESWPTVSPDGGQVAYTAYPKDGESEGAALMVQATAPVPPRELTPRVKGRSDVMAAWSPDGRQIVFTRYEGDHCSLLLMPSSGGTTRTIGKCFDDQMPWYSWHPDARHLVASGVGETPGAAQRFQVLDLATGAWAPLPYEKNDTDVDTSPMYSPDGRWIAFQRNISLSDLWRVPAAGGKPERLTRLRINIYGLAWTPDSQSIVFAGYRDDGAVLQRLDIGSGAVTDLGSSELDTAFPSISRGTPSLAFMLTRSHSGIFSLPMGDANAGATPAPEPVFPSSGKDLLPAIAPDGQQIAFVSDRSARPGVWWAELDRAESLRLIDGVIPAARYAPVWSSDSQRLLVAGRSPASNEAGIYEITPASAQVRRLEVPADSPIRAEYLPDPARLLVVADIGGGRLGLMLYDRTTTPWRVLALIDDVVFAKVDAARGRVLFTRPARPGLWQAGLDLAQPKFIAERPAAGAPSSRRLVVGQQGLWLAASDEQCGLRWTALEEPGQPSRCLHAGKLGVTSFSYDSRRQRLYYSSELADNSDIGWMQLPATSRR
jgi:Tol biopolymer transport system component/DNA-binding winged helix-turn-helix (wHTH) protein